jgi:tRNA dimethylallyltransferase
VELVCVLGPTAIGKTRLAVALARELSGEVLSADSRQVYRGMDLGTGKDLEEYRFGGEEIRVNLVDIVDGGTEFTVFDYQRAFLAAFREARARNSMPILCGGSGLYLEAVLSGYRLVEVPGDESLRDELRGETTEQLVARLARLRPLHNITDTRDRERLLRAIEIAVHSRAFGGETFPRIRSKAYGLRLQRTELRRRITNRLTTRLDSGLVEEVRGLLERGLTPSQLEYYGLEYRYVTKYVTGELRRNDMFQKLNSAIHQFAKRQETWFRRMERRGTSITWLDARRPIEDLVGLVVADLEE